jgi:hypothetical protein
MQFTIIHLPKKEIKLNSNKHKKLETMFTSFLAIILKAYSKILETLIE